MPQENFGSRPDQVLAAPEASMPAELPWTEASAFDEVRDALAAPITDARIDPERSPVARAEMPEVERRVQALERLLQALLVQLAKSDPDLRARLDEAFSASSLSARVDDDKAIDSCAAALVRAALRTEGEAAEPSPEVAEASGPPVEARPGDAHKDELAFRRPAFHYRKVGGIWRLTMDRPPRPGAKKGEDGELARPAAPPGDFTPPRPAGRRSSS